AELLETTEAGATVVILTNGSLTGALAKAVRELGETETVKKFRERDAAKWLSEETTQRELRLGDGAAGALLERFGSDVAGLSQALDQLAASSGPITRQTVLDRFRNRPDEPMWHYADAVSDGKAGEALRRLSDFWTHGHPLQLVGFLENELRHRALAATAPDLETFATWIDRSPSEYPVKKAWSRRASVSDSELTASLQALRRADEVLKTAPPEVHRVTMERLTVALCRWYGGKARRAS
ncbi:MAG: DNA polymerase III subunit delta, partial [Acidimicrobiia bacterium]